MSGAPSRCRIDETGPAMVHVGMGWAPADAVARDAGIRSRAAADEHARRDALHRAGVARRRKRKRGGPR